MQNAELKLKMWKEKDKFNPPLTKEEIFEFVDYNSDNLPNIVPDTNKIEEARVLKKITEDWYLPSYKTKKATREAIKKINQEVDELLDKKFKTQDEYYDLLIEKEVNKKQRLQARLVVPEGLYADKIQRAKAVSMELFLQFDRSGFVSCPFHGPERTPSAKLYRADNRLHCFGCGVTKDVIDVVQVLNNVDFNSALKIILQ